MKVQGNWSASKDAHLSLFNLTNLLFAEGNPAGIKAVLEIRRICSDHVRLPLVPATSRLKASIKAELDRLDF